MPAPVFVSFEGGEGSGKSTQARLLYDRMVRENIPVELVREPGSTSFGDYLREYLKDEHLPLAGAAELLLFAAARAQLVTELILPCLEGGTSVVADRYADSTAAYQGYGRGLSLEDITYLNTLATGNITPHVTFLLDVAPDSGHRDVGTQQLALPFGAEETAPASPHVEERQRRFENLPLEFHKRVRDGYKQLVEQEPDRWVVLDATLTVGQISDQVWQKVSALLAK